MGYFHVHSKNIGRTRGESAVRKAIYNSRTKGEDRNSGRKYDFRSKGEVLFTRIRAPDNSPLWVGRLIDEGGDAFWSEGESCEIRKDAQLAQEITFGIPYQLVGDGHDVSRVIPALMEFVDENFVSKGRIADIAIHPPPADGDPRHYHAHVMLTLREITPSGFGKKNRDWLKYGDRSYITDLRKKWADTLNACLEKNGLRERVDHRSLKEQGINREPSRYKGKARTDIERKLMKEQKMANGQELERGTGDDACGKVELVRQHYNKGRSR